MGMKTDSTKEEKGEEEEETDSGNEAF